VRQNIIGRRDVFLERTADGINVMATRGMRTAVFNLFDNAIKYSGEKKKLSDILARTLIRCRSAYATTRRIQAKSERIFKRFYRAPNPISRELKERPGVVHVRSNARRHERRLRESQEKGWADVHYAAAEIYQAEPHTDGPKTKRTWHRAAL